MKYSGVFVFIDTQEITRLCDTIVRHYELQDMMECMKLRNRELNYPNLLYFYNDYSNILWF